jgi:dCTP deaminase
MTFWGGTRWLEEGKAKAIVTPFDDAKIDCSAYTLTLGEEAYVTPNYGDDLRQNQKATLVAPSVEIIGGKKRNKGGGSIVIPPGQFAFLLTEEIVSMPPDAMGFISLKSSVKFRGLINVSGFHVDPGFNGRLIYSVFNAGPSVIQLARGDLLFLLWIADLSGDVQKRFQKTEPGHAGIPSALITDVSRENRSLQALSGQIDAIAEQFRIIKGVAVGIVSALALLVAVLALKPVFWGDPPSPANVNASQEQASQAVEPTRLLPPPTIPPETTAPAKHPTPSRT